MEWGYIEISNGLKIGLYGPINGRFEDGRGNPAPTIISGPSFAFHLS